MTKKEEEEWNRKLEAWSRFPPMDEWIPEHLKNGQKEPPRHRTRRGNEMGMFDSVFVPCPNCGRQNELQTKNGPCVLGKYTLDDVPPEVLLGVSDVDQTCKHCEAPFVVRAQVLTRQWVERVKP